MTKIQTYTRILQALSVACIVFMTAIIAIRWFFDSFANVPSVLWVRPLLGFFATDTSWHTELKLIPLTQRFAGLCVDGVAIAICASGVLTFNQLMNKFHEGIFFSQDILRQIHMLSRIALWYAVYNPVRTTLLSIITTAHRGTGNRILAAEFTTYDVINIFIFGCFVLITALIQEGSKLKKEHDLTI